MFQYKRFEVLNVKAKTIIDYKIEPNSKNSIFCFDIYIFEIQVISLLNPADILSR